MKEQDGVGGHWRDPRSTVPASVRHAEQIRHRERHSHMPGHRSLVQCAGCHRPCTRSSRPPPLAADAPSEQSPRPFDSTMGNTRSGWEFTESNERPTDLAVEACRKRNKRPPERHLHTIEKFGGRKARLRLPRELRGLPAACSDSGERRGGRRKRKAAAGAAGLGSSAQTARTGDAEEENMIRGSVDTRLETWDDPTPRESEFTLDDLVEAFVEAGRKHFSLRARYTRPTSEEHVRQREEDDRKSAMIALEVYIKQNNMQHTDLEFVELKESNFIGECAKGYLHLNFLVKESDGKRTMFFAEVRYNLKDEKDVYLCTPLGKDDLKPSKKNDDQARCKGCLYRARNLIHPSCGSFLGGHRYIAWPHQDTRDFELDEEII